MRENPNPGDVRLMADQTNGLPAPVARVLRLLGDAPTDQTVAAIEAKYGTDHLRALMTGSHVIENFASYRALATGRPQRELFELLMLEHWIHWAPTAVVANLPKGFSLTKTIHTIRQSIAVEVFNIAAGLNWREPLTYVRALRFSEGYFRVLVEMKHLTKPDSRMGFAGRLAASVIRISRYVDVEEASLLQAISILRELASEGDARFTPVPLLAESLLRLNTLTGDRSALIELSRLEPPLENPMRERFDSHVSEAWLRLSEHAESSLGRSGFLNRARVSALAIVGSTSDPVIELRGRLTIGLTDVWERPDVDTGFFKLNSLNLPFGVPRTLRAWAAVDPTAARELAVALIASLNAGQPKSKSQPAYRRLHAALLSELAAMYLPESRARGNYLQAAIDLRAGGGAVRPLADVSSRLESALDLLQLWKSSRSSVALADALCALLALTDSAQSWPTPLVLLARELENFQEFLTPAVRYRLSLLNLRQAAPIRALLLASDSDGLYQEAATAALDSREVDRRRIGGRAGVYVAEDYSGVISDSFVFKVTHRSLAERELSREGLIRARLQELGLTRFAIAHTLAINSLPVDEPMRIDNCDVIVARQFHDGQLLSAIADTSDASQTNRALRETVEFLALIQGVEAHGGAPAGGWQEMRRKELGRWLRSGLQALDAAELFGQWRDLFPSIASVPRRDSHPENWLRASTGEMVALDLEATGWRPAGYELAQLTDDYPMLPLNEKGWDARVALVELYATSLRSNGVAIDETDLLVSYELSLAARAVRCVTDPNASAAVRSHGESLLFFLAARRPGAPASALAEVFLLRWQARRALMTDQGSEISEGRRIHLSRAIAFQLRHGSAVEIDDQGWGSISSLVGALRADGIRCTAAELSRVVRAIDEYRFDSRDDQVRARYGHTRPVHIDYRISDQEILYHGTSTDSLDSILEPGGGLRSMERQWVHLTDDPASAMLTGRRHGVPCILRIRCGDFAVPVYHAGGSVFLSRSVPAEAIQLLTLAEEFQIGLKR